ncbi:MAG: hypothetical protein M3340_15380 [Actinomycetota bacterium]|nr:hypothetical protein [Actinomycetota bacterium]
MNGLESLVDGVTEGFRWLTGPEGSAVGAWFLAGVFAWSGIAKARAPELAAMAMTDFGVLRRPSARAGVALAAGEILLAILLAVAAVTLGSVALAVFAAATALLLSFVVLIASNVARGRRTPCACFGNADETVSGRSLLRTGALAALASVLLLGGPPHDVDQGLYVLASEAVLAASALGTAVTLGLLLRLARLAGDLRRGAAS